MVAYVCVFGVPGDAVEGVAVELSAHVSHTSLLKPFIPDSSPPAQPAQRTPPHPTRLHPFPSPVSLRCSHCSRPHPSSPRVASCPPALIFSRDVRHKNQQLAAKTFAVFCH